MKLFLTATLMLFITLCSSHTLWGATSRASIGVQTGLSLSQIAVPTSLSSEPVTGFAAGVAAEVPLSGPFSLQPEATFVQRGAKIIDSVGIRAIAEYDSLEVPVLLKAEFGETVRPFFLAGPNLVFNLSHRMRAQTPGESSSVSFNPNTVDFGAAIAAGVELGAFFTNLRYEIGFTELNGTSASWRSRGFLFLAGIAL